jgi:hypothetical protein
VVVGDRVEVVDHLEPRPVLAARVLQVVHGREVHEDVEAERGLVAARAQDVLEDAAVHHDRGIPPVLVGLDDGGAEPAREVMEDRSARH